MPNTVAQHAVATFTSPVNGTSPIDANTVRGNDNTIRTSYNSHDADPGVHVQSSTLASRPVAGTSGRKWITADAGSYKLWYDDGTIWHEVANTGVDVFVVAGETLVKGDIIKVTGYNNGLSAPIVVKVTSASDVAFGIVLAAISNGGTGYIANTGLVADLNTNAFVIGDILYPNTSGGLTSTKPVAGTYQPVAYVLRSNTNNGVLYVEFSSPRITERSNNTASTLVLRDASGNFAAGTITAGAVTSTGLVTVASLKGTGATTVTNILDEDNMASNSATALATQQSIKAYVDAQVATVDTLAEVLANGNTTGANDISVNAGQKIRTPAVAAQDGTASISIANSTGAVTLSVGLADSNLATISTGGKVSNTATTATSANTASAIVARDGSGNFTAGTVTAALTGNASTATALATARNINGVAFDGTADITVTAAAGTLTGATLASNVLASSLTSVGTLAALTVTAPITGSVTGSSGSTTGNAATATTLATPRNINGVSFNGSADITVTAAAGTLSGATLASGVTASSLTSVGTLTALTVSGTSTLGGSTDKVIINRLSDFTAYGSVSLNGALASTTMSGLYGRGSGGDAGTLAYTVPAGSSHKFQIAGVDAMTLNASGDVTVSSSTILGNASNDLLTISGQTLIGHSASVGANPNVLQIKSTGAFGGSLGIVSANNEVAGSLRLASSGTNSIVLQVDPENLRASSDFSLSVDGTERARIDASGNLGLGVTPSAWDANRLCVQIGGSTSGHLAYNAATGNLTANAFFDTTDARYEYIGTGFATRYEQTAGTHAWFTAPSGTAGGAISFVERARIPAAGDFNCANKIRAGALTGNAAALRYEAASPVLNASATLAASIDYARIQVYESTNTGSGADFFLAAGVLTKVTDPDNVFSVVAGTAGKINVTFASSTLTVENKRGANDNYRAVITQFG